VSPRPRSLSIANSLAGSLYGGSSPPSLRRGCRARTREATVQWSDLDSADSAKILYSEDDQRVPLNLYRVKVRVESY